MGLVGRKVIQHHGRHDARAFDAGLAMAYRRINRDTSSPIHWVRMPTDHRCHRQIQSPQPETSLNFFPAECRGCSSHR